jgi:hypothetical protein
MKHIPRNQNQEANRLAQSASGYQQIVEVLADEVVDEGDWRKNIIEYLKNPSQQVSRKLRYKALRSVLLDDQLYHRIVDGVPLKCLNQEEAKVSMGNIHEGVCGAHQSTHKMKWVIRRQVISGRPCWKIVSNIMKDVKNARSLVIFKNL